MAKTVVVTDSIACIPPELVKKYDIHVAPLHIIWDKTGYREGVDMTIKDFYARLRTSKTLPTTSSSIQGEFIELFERLTKQAGSIVVITVTGALGTADVSAINAREIVGSDVPIEVIDSRTGLMAQGFIVLEAAKVAAAGGSLAETAKAAREAIPRVEIFWAMDTLEYMRRGGRISLPQAILAGWLRVKPIVTIKDGKVAPLDRVRTKPRAIEKLLEIMAGKITGTGPLHVAVMHGDVHDEAERLKQLVSDRFQCAEIFTSEITPVIGTHVGPGALGLALYQE